MKIITKQVEVEVLKDIYEGEEFLKQEIVKELVEKKFIVIPQPDKEIEYDVYMAEIQQEKEQAENAVIEAQEKIAVKTEELEKIELLDSK